MNLKLCKHNSTSLNSGSVPFAAYCHSIFL